MKKILFVPLVMLLLAGIVFSVSVQPAAAKTIELTYNIPCHGPQQPGVYYPTDYIAKEIGKRTEGRVKVTVFWGATLAPPPETFRAVLKGVCDIGQSNAGYTKGLFPVSFANRWKQRREMHDDVHTFGGLSDRLGVGDVPFHDLDVLEALQARKAAHR